MTIHTLTQLRSALEGAQFTPAEADEIKKFIDSRTRLPQRCGHTMTLMQPGSGLTEHSCVLIQRHKDLAHSDGTISWIVVIR